MQQQSIAREISCSGIALHSGEKSRIVFKPAQVDEGIVFVRTDYSARVPIPAVWRYVVDTVNKVALGREGIEIKTVEHVLSALYGLGVDNCLIELDNIEPPVLDGSARVFVDLILEAGIVEQEKEREYFSVPCPVWIEEGDKYLVVLPSDEYKISCSIEFNHPVLKKQSSHMKITPETFVHEIARARTFGFWEDVSRMWEQGLAFGGSLNSALVYHDSGILNDSLRYEDECVRHKILDLVGDFALLGRHMRGHIIAHRSGHALDVMMVQKLAALMHGEIPVSGVEESQFDAFRKKYL